MEPPFILFQPTRLILILYLTADFFVAKYLGTYRPAKDFQTSLYLDHNNPTSNFIQYCLFVDSYF